MGIFEGINPFDDEPWVLNPLTNPLMLMLLLGIGQRTGAKNILMPFMLMLLLGNTKSKDSIPEEPGINNDAWDKLWKGISPFDKDRWLPLPEQVPSPVTAQIPEIPETNEIQVYQPDIFVPVSIPAPTDITLPPILPENIDPGFLAPWFPSTGAPHEIINALKNKPASVDYFPWPFPGEN